MNSASHQSETNDPVFQTYFTRSDLEEEFVNSASHQSETNDLFFKHTLHD